jgi:hypothetical protein
VKEIGEDACAQCKALIVVVLPSTLRSIGPGAFSHTKLRRVDLPARLDLLGGGAFERCQALTALTLGDVARWGVRRHEEIPYGWHQDEDGHWVYEGRAAYTVRAFDAEKRIAELRLIGRQWSSLDFDVLEGCLTRSAKVTSDHFVGHGIGSCLIRPL